MNRSYRTVWKEAAGMYVAVPETATTRGLRIAGAGLVRAAAGVVSLAGAAVGLCGADAYAGALDGGFVSGNGEAIGSGASSTSSGAVSIGANGGNAAYGAFATGQDSVAVGVVSSATGVAAVAIGETVTASGAYATALGPHSTATGTSSTAIGGASATAPSAVAVGSGASATASNSVALGAGATTTANVSAAAYNPGSSTLSGTAPVGEASIGAAGAERRLTNVAAGSSATDAVNVSQLRSEDTKVNAQGSSVAAAIGGGSSYNPTTGALTSPSLVVGGTTQTSVAGALTNLDGRVTQNAGDISNLTSELNSGTIGLVQQASPTGTVTVAAATGGTLVDFTGTAGTRVLTGVSAGNLSAASTDAVNGSQLYATNQNVSNLSNNVGGLNDAVNNIVNGGGIKYFHDNSTLTDSQATGTEAIAIGGGAVASASNSVALGANATTTADLTAAAYDPGTTALSGTTPVGEVSIGSAGNERRLTNVAAGAAPTDAVNVSQLQSEDAKVGTQGQSIANIIGGGSTYDPTTGSLSNPAFVVGGTTMTTVAGALTNLDGRVTQNASDISNISSELDSGTIGLVQQPSPTGTVTVAAGTGGTLVDFTGTAGARRLTGVAAGGVSATSVDAINGSQLYAASQSTAAALGGGSTVNPDGTVSAPSYVIDGGVTASSVGAALTNLDGRVAQNTSDIGNLNNDVTNLSSTLNNITSGAGLKYAHTNSTLADSQATGTNATAIGAAAVASGSQAVALGSNATASAASSVALGAGSVADRANSVSVGTAGNERQITNVAAGTQGTDAVNVTQLNQSLASAVGNLPPGVSSKQYTDQQINMVQQGVNQVARSAYSGIAAATALTMVPGVPEGRTLAVGVGTATYKGYQAVALGASVRVSQALEVKGGAGYSSDGVTAGLGASYVW